MIKNERQYKISKTHLERFVTLRNKIRLSQDAFAGIHLAAHDSQIKTLRKDIADYEELIEGRISAFSSISLQELPITLIKSRIAKGMTQKSLSLILGVKEQQIQRWESDNYESASLSTLRLIANALGVNISSDLILEDPSKISNTLVENLALIGFNKALLSKILPVSSFEALAGSSLSAEAIWEAFRQLSSILGISVANLINNPAMPHFSYGSSVRYKMRANANLEKVDAFTIYAHYVAAVACKARRVPPTLQLAGSWLDFRNTLLANFQSISLESVLDYAWLCGIAVIPIVHPGAFHGAVWKIGGCYVIILKQNTSQVSRWLFDLLHEIGHIACGHVSETSAILEVEPIAPKESENDDDETVANEWAEDVVFGGQSTLIEKEVIRAARGNVEQIKKSVGLISEKYDVPKGMLANHMAWRLSTQNIDWWGAAENLQKDDLCPIEIVKKKLQTYLDIDSLTDPDRTLFIKAIEKP